MTRRIIDNNERGTFELKALRIKVKPEKLLEKTDSE
ncbi:hypothetical protein VIBHAR_01496 [Vibrio campbellii ATCC BAA-1116]|uniref:Uncharacterized protein n=1 Tax=Vibrio campbellii (strain ATCC BAA-1116) TaxID=2902295 RepID=A7MV38_VIBC1|nr:hypothetical protein VIBHAR_01496 [Vibrio campbellii ATCC BAA-1116]